MAAICELTRCVSRHKNFVGIHVNENIEDQSFRTFICQDCADALGLQEGYDLPDNIININRLLNAARRKKENDNSEKLHTKD